MAQLGHDFTGICAAGMVFLLLELREQLGAGLGRSTGVGLVVNVTRGNRWAFINGVTPHCHVVGIGRVFVIVKIASSSRYGSLTNFERASVGGKTTS